MDREIDCDPDFYERLINKTRRLTARPAIGAFRTSFRWRALLRTDRIDLLVWRLKSRI